MRPSCLACHPGSTCRKSSLDLFIGSHSTSLLDCVRNSKAQLIVLPGYSAGITPTPEQVQAAIPQDCTVFVEAAPASDGIGKTIARPQSKRSSEPWDPYQPYLATRESVTAIPRQLFARSRTGPLTLPGSASPSSCAARSPHSTQAAA